MVKCCHESCGCEERIWLPKGSKTLVDIIVTSSSGLSDVAPHRWCIHCGLVKNISDDKPKKIGFWINILSMVTKKYFVTQSQIRLITKELNSYESFNDLYGTTGSSQKEAFIKVVKKYCNIHESIINSFIC